MILLHQIGNVKGNSNFNTIEQIKACKDSLSFDGIYESVLHHVDDLVGKDIILFFSGEHLGKDNSFDKDQPLTKFCDIDQVLWLQKKLNCKLGYHSYSHRDLSTLNESELINEINPPMSLDLFAYPYGRYNDLVINLLKEFGYKDAWSVTQGDDTPFKRKRRYL